ADGVISAMSGFKGDANEMQVQLPLHSGNSGGPLVTTRGEVVGVVVAGLVQGQLVSYATKSDSAIALLSETPKKRKLTGKLPTWVRKATCRISTFRYED